MLYNSWKNVCWGGFLKKTQVNVKIKIKVQILRMINSTHKDDVYMRSIPSKSSYSSIIYCNGHDYKNSVLYYKVSATELKLFQLRNETHSESASVHIILKFRIVQIAPSSSGIL